MSEHSPEHLDYAEDIVEDVKIKDDQAIDVSSGEDSGKVSNSDSQSEGQTVSESDPDSDGETDASGSSSEREEPKQEDNPWTRGLMLAKERIQKSKQQRQEKSQTGASDAMKLKAPVKNKDLSLLSTEEFYLEFDSFSASNPVYTDYYQQSFIGHTPLTWKRVLPSDVCEPSTKKINVWRKKAKKNGDNRRNRYSSESSNSNSDSGSSDSDEKESDEENDQTKTQSCPSPVSSYSSGLSSLVESYLDFPLSPKRNNSRKNRSRSNSRKRRSSSSGSSNDSSSSSNHSKVRNQPANNSNNQRRGRPGHNEFRDYNSWRQNQYSTTGDNRRNNYQNRYQNNSIRGRNDNRFNRYNYNSNNPRFNNNSNNNGPNDHNNYRRHESPQREDRFNRRNDQSNRRRPQPTRPVPPTYNSSHSSRSSSSRSSSNRRYKKPNYRDRSPVHSNARGHRRRSYKRSTSRSSSSNDSRPSFPSKVKSDPNHLAPLLAGAVNPTKEVGPPSKISLNEPSESYSGTKRRIGRSRSSSSSMSEPENKRRLQNALYSKRPKDDTDDSDTGSFKGRHDNLTGNVNRERSPFDASVGNSNSGNSTTNQDRLRELRERLTMVNDAIANITSQK